MDPLSQVHAYMGVAGFERMKGVEKIGSYISEAVEKTYATAVKIYSVAATVFQLIKSGNACSLAVNAFQLITGKDDKDVMGNRGKQLENSVVTSFISDLMTKKDNFDFINTQMLGTTKMEDAPRLIEEIKSKLKAQAQGDNSKRIVIPLVLESDNIGFEFKYIDRGFEFRHRDTGLGLRYSDKGFEFRNSDKGFGEEGLAFRHIVYMEFDPAKSRIVYCDSQGEPINSKKLGSATMADFIATISEGIKDTPIPILEMKTNVQDNLSDCGARVAHLINWMFGEGLSAEEAMGRPISGHDITQFRIDMKDITAKYKYNPPDREEENPNPFLESGDDW